MNSIQNIDRFIIPNNDIVSLTTIYRWIGQNNTFKEIVGSDLPRVVTQTVERDAYFLSLILGLEISDTRSRLIITKDSSPRTKDESTLYNLKEILGSIQNDYKSRNIFSNDIYNMINEVYVHYGPIRYDITSDGKKNVLQSQGQKSKRLIIDEITTLVGERLEKKNFEKITLFMHYFIDFYNVKPFTNQNYTASILLMYLLVLKCDLDAFRYISFFEILYENYDTFKKELNNASYNWKEGYAQTLEFIRFMYKIILTGYEKTNEIIKNYKFDQSINKGTNIENTISRLPDVFTKEEIRLVHPYVSESTINRALTHLRDEGLIRPLGKGRSAKWTKIKGYRK